MTFQHMKFNHGDPVVIYDQRKRYDGKGVICGRHESRDGPIYDIQPEGELSLSERRRGIPEAQLRLASGEVERMVRAYSGPRVPPLPRHIRDEV
jgi:hypothetical protein